MTRDLLSRIFHGCYFVLFAIVFGYIIGQQRYLPILFFACTAVFIFLIWGVKSTHKMKVSDSQLNLLTGGGLAVMAVLMAIIGWMMIPLLKTDLGTVYYSAMEIIENGHVNDVFTDYNKMTMITNMTNNEYFVTYPNNLPILFLLTSFYRIVCGMGISMDSDFGVYMGVLLNIAFILFAVWIGSRVARRVWGNKGALGFLLFSVLFIPYYTNASRFYTDTLTLPFPVLAIYMYMRIRETKDLKKRTLWGAGLGFCLTVGFLLKGSCIIVAVALIVHSIISGFKRRNLGTLLIIALTFSILFQGWNHYVRNCSWVDMSREEELTFPAAHWIMMSLSGNGGFHQKDFDYTFSFGSKAEKQAGDIKRAKEKIKKMGGVEDFINFELRKISQTWGDGKFAQQAHLDWMRKDSVIQEFTGEEGRYHSVFYLYITTFILVMYVLFLVSIAGGMFRKNNICSLFNICIFGVLLFFAVWETKSRYLLNFTPVFFLCALDGIHILARQKFLTQRLEKI